MIETKTQINERLELCNQRFRDKSYPYDMKQWETFVSWTLSGKLENRDYKGE